MVVLTYETMQAVGPVDGWRRLLRDWFTVGSSTVACQALGVATSLVLRTLLDPGQMGVWQGLKLALGYANYANLGVSKGAMREITIAVGRQDQMVIERNASLAFTFNTVTSLVYAAVLTAIGVWMATTNDPYAKSWATGLAIIAVVAVLQRHLAFLVNVLRARQRFGLTARLSLCEATSALVLGAGGTWLFGLPGLCCGTALAVTFSLGWLHHVAGIPLRWSWDAAELRRLAVIGLPILGLGVGTALARSIDRWMILACTNDGETQLGYYSLAMLVTGQLAGIASMFSIVIGPRYGQLLGATGSRRSVARLAARMTEPKAAVMALAGLGSLLLAPVLFARLLPSYEPGIGALLIRVPGAIAVSLTIPASQYLVTVNRQQHALAILIGPLALAGAGSWWALHHGYGIDGVAWAMTASDLLYLAMNSLLAFGRELNPRELGRYLATLLMVLIPLIAFCHMSIGDDGLIVGGSCCALIWIPATVVAWRSGWSSVCFEEQRCVGSR